jgi:hypothetical protein
MYTAVALAMSRSNNNWRYRQTKLTCMVLSLVETSYLIFISRSHCIFWFPGKTPGKPPHDWLECYIIIQLCVFRKWTIGQEVRESTKRGFSLVQNKENSLIHAVTCVTQANLRSVVLFTVYSNLLSLVFKVSFRSIQGLRTGLTGNSSRLDLTQMDTDG